MGDQDKENIGVSFNTEVKTPTTIDPGLPAVLVVFLSTEGRVAEILEKKTGLFLKSPLDVGRSGLVTAAKPLRVQEPHREALVLPFLWRERTISFTDRNGP